MRNKMSRLGRWQIMAGAAAIMAASAVVGVASTAGAATCTGAVSYPSTSNAIYLNDSTRPYLLLGPSQLRTNCLRAPPDGSLRQPNRDAAHLPPGAGDPNRRRGSLTLTATDLRYDEGPHRLM